MKSDPAEPVLTPSSQVMANLSDGAEASPSGVKVHASRHFLTSEFVIYQHLAANKARRVFRGESVASVRVERGGMQTETVAWVTRQAQAVHATR